MTLLIGIDPGMSTGVVLVRYEPNTPMRVMAVDQVNGGLDGLIAAELIPFQSLGVKVTCESFSPRPGARSWKLEELEPIRVEGWLRGHVGRDIYWRRPESRFLLKTESLTKKFLKDSGYWVSKGDVGQKDPNDANSAMMHALGYLRDHGHKPTIDMLIEYGEKMTEEDE